METVTLYLYDREENGEPVFSLEPDPTAKTTAAAAMRCPHTTFTAAANSSRKKANPAPYRPTTPAAARRHDERPRLPDGARAENHAHARKTGLSQEAFAEALGVSQLTLYRFEHNEEEPHSAILSRMAQVLHCDVLDLI